MKVTVAATQMACSWNLEENLDTAERLVRAAAKQGANVILLQEMFATHFFADGSFAWLRRRFIALSMPMRGLLLVGVCLVLRELAHHDIVKFIYFQF